MPTDPLTGSRYPVGTDGPDLATIIKNAVIDLSDNTVPRFSTTTARDTAYSSWVTLGGTMADGMLCTANGIPYRRIGGTWRVDRDVPVHRSTAPASTISGGGANETGATSGIAALSSFTLYEAATVVVSASFRAGGAGVGLCMVKINGTQVGDLGIARNDISVPVVGTVALAAGTHTSSLRVEAPPGSSIDWTNARIVITGGITSG